LTRSTWRGRMEAPASRTTARSKRGRRETTKAGRRSPATESSRHPIY
jgi:hypothetical protein